MHYWAGVLLMASLLLAFHAVEGDQNIIISKGLIVKLCSDTCQQSSEKSVAEDCQRGCRFFDYAQSSNLAVESNETAFQTLCVDSCKDAYLAIGKNQDACVVGCRNAKDEVDKIVQMGNQLLEEADKQMNFLNSIMDMMSSAFWSSENENSSEEDGEISKSVGQLIDGNNPPKFNRLDKQMDAGDVEIITLLGNELDQAQASFCYTRMWLHRLSFILIVLGALSLFFISFFYILAVIKHKKAQKNAAQLSADMPAANPPSYETLVKNGYIVVDANDIVIAPVHEEKKEKLLL